MFPMKTSNLKTRYFWLDRIEKTWRRPVLWLSGVRRVGKTCLCKTVPNVEYFDCELPRVRRQMEAPEAFLEDLRGCRVVLDEVHRLDNPSELLKIAADHYPDVRIIATGSSTLGTSARFKDTLAGRKSELWLTPMTKADLVDFGQTNLQYRFLRGGYHLSSWSKNCQNGSFKNGWMHIGPKTSRSCSASSAVILFRGFWNW